MIEIPGIKENPLPKELMQFLTEVQENPSIYAETVVFNRIKDYIVDLSPKQVAWLTSTIILTTEFRLRVFKKRCDVGDKLACETLALTVDGDPYSKNPTVKKGIMGLWRIDNDVEAGKLLVELERITQDEFDNIMKTGRDKEIIINGKTRDQKLGELAAEAKTYTTADAFSMAMIMGRLKSVPLPNTKNVYEIIKGKYGSAEEFWNAVGTGEISVPAAVEVKPPEPVEKPLEERYKDYLAEIKVFFENLPPRPPKGDESRIILVAQESNRLRKKYNIPMSFFPAGEKADWEKKMELAMKLVKPEEKEIPPPPKEKEVPRLDLFKKEIEDRIAEMKRKAKKGVKEGLENTGVKEEPGIAADMMRGMYANWKYEDYADAIRFAKRLEDLEVIREHIGDSMVTSQEEKQKIHELIAQREVELKSPEARKELEKEEAELTEAEAPEDYTQYTYGDFEALIKGLDSIEDLEDISDYIDMSKAITRDERKMLENLVEKRMTEIQREE